MVWQCYVPSEADRSHPYASPGNAPSLKRLPPAIIAIATIDPLRDDGRDYALRLIEHGNRAESLEYPTMPHGFFSMAAVAPAAMAAVREMADP